MNLHVDGFGLNALKRKGCDAADHAKLLNHHNGLADRLEQIKNKLRIEANNAIFNRFSGCFSGAETFLVQAWNGLKAAD